MQFNCSKEKQNETQYNQEAKILFESNIKSICYNEC